MKASKQDLVATKTVSEEKAETMNRKAVRGWSRQQVRIGRRTGKTAHFAAWKAEGQLKSILQRTKTSAVAASLSGPDNGAAAGFRLLAEAGIKNLWDVSQADRAALLAVKGVGVARLAFIADYLTSKGIELAWSVDA